MKKSGFNGYVFYDFSVPYDATDNDDIKDIDNYLMKKIISCKCKYLDLWRKYFS